MLRPEHDLALEMLFLMQDSYSCFNYLLIRHILWNKVFFRTRKTIFIRPSVHNWQLFAPGHGNWGEQLPVVYRWPYEYGLPGAKEDFIPQNVPDEQIVKA